MRPELNVKKKVQSLERRKAQLDALINFLKTHPQVASEAYLHNLNGRVGLRFDYAMIRPLSQDNQVVLRLEKYSDDWDEHPEMQPGYFDKSHLMVRSDVSNMPEEELLELLDKVHQELIPEDFE